MNISHNKTNYFNMALLDSLSIIAFRLCDVLTI